MRPMRFLSSVSGPRAAGIAVLCLLGAATARADDGGSPGDGGATDGAADFAFFDGSIADLAVLADFSPPRDFAAGPDQTARPDLSIGADVAAPSDFARPADAVQRDTAVPDLAESDASADGGASPELGTEDL